MSPETEPGNDLETALERAGDQRADAGTATPAVRRARAWLSRAAEPGTVDFWRFVERVGPVDAVLSIRSGRAPARISDLVGARAATDRSLTDLRQAARCGARLVTPEDDEWPHLQLHALTLAVAGEPTERRNQSDRTKAPVPPLALAERALERGALSVRGFDRVQRVAWTLADLAGRTVPGSDDVGEALGMRLQRRAAA